MHTKPFDPAALIFPAIMPLPQVLGEPRLRQDVLKQLSSVPEAFACFDTLSAQAKEAFLGFCMGNRGLKITFDPFFQHIFHPDKHPGRLDRLISCILGQPVTVEKTLSRERSRFSEKSSLIIMDILVRLCNGSLVNVEMQRIGYDFPGERGCCYGADLLIRQYDIVHETQGKEFSYRDMKPVYVIVFLEQSTSVFHKYPDKYIHRSALTFDTGLQMHSLQNFIYIPLDIFRQMEHNELTELEAWLYFLSSDRPADILRILEKYPFFQALYQDIVYFRYHPKELITMFSDALRIMDENTVKYMVDELKAELAAQKAELNARTTELAAKDAEIKKLHTMLAQCQVQK